MNRHNMIVTEENYICRPDQFWEIRDSKEWETGWSLYTKDLPSTQLTDREKAMNWWNKLHTADIRVFQEDYKTKLFSPQEIEEIWRKETNQSSSVVEDESKGFVSELYTALHDIVNDWIGEGNFRDLPELKSSTADKTEEFKYWSPAGKLVKAELIAKGIEALQKENPNFKP